MPPRHEPPTPLDTWNASRDETLFLPGKREGAGGATDSRAALALPPDLRRQATQRLRRIALIDRKSTRLNSSHIQKSRMPSSA